MEQEMNFKEMVDSVKLNKRQKSSIEGRSVSRWNRPQKVEGLSVKPRYFYS